MIYINEIQVNECRNIKKLNIPLSSKKLQHLIITGKNGSGKTSLLMGLKNTLLSIESGEYFNLKKNKNNRKNFEDAIIRLKNKKDFTQEDKNSIDNLKEYIKNIDRWLDNFNKLKISFSNTTDLKNIYNEGKFIITYFDANRLANQKIPKGIEKYNLKNKYSVKDRIGEYFLQYMVNLRADQAFARNEGDIEDVKKIDAWFASFTSMIQDIFDSPNLKLTFDRKKYSFNIVEKNKQISPFTNLADGYSSILSIVSELILRMENHKGKNYDINGIVLIDEIETHLHIELQKKVLPILINIFPNIQFIVSTHSPFVISSITDSVICDLENKIITENLSGYSSDIIIESYFNSDKYSKPLKDKLAEYEKLITQKNISNKQQHKLEELENYFDVLPKYLSPELEVKLQQLKLKNLKIQKKND